MYESFFGLRKRPFAAAADPTLLVELPAVAAAVEKIDRCVRDGAGVAILTAAAGLGKTHLCQWLARRWRDEFVVALLPNAAYPSRRSLLQAVLYELGRSQRRLGEAELRSELAAAAREARGDRAGVVLVLDEAHRYSEKLLDEVRAIANLVEEGSPLVRIVLAGHLDLEEKLADPAAAGLNDRVGAQVTLPRLTAAESASYLQTRAALAGGDLDVLFDSAAVELIVRACGGVPRCLNQLADHGLLLGYVGERRPVDAATVREALDDLKRLPLQWAEPFAVETPAEVAGRATSAARPVEPLANVIEIGELDATEGDDCDFTDETAEVVEFGELDLAPEVPAQPPKPPAVPVPPAAPIGEQPVVDRYAGLDAAERRRAWFETLEALERPIEPQAEIPAPVETPAAASTPAAEPERTEPARPADRPTVDPLALLDRLEPLVAEAIGEFSGEVAAAKAGRPDRASVIDRAAELERLVQALEQATAAAAVDVAPSPRPAFESERRQSTLFRDLRRREAGRH